MDVKLVASKIFNSRVKSTEEFRVRVQQPNMNACIRSSEIITCTQAANDSEAKEGAMKIFQTLQNYGFQVNFDNYRIFSVAVIFQMGFTINIRSFVHLYGTSLSKVYHDPAAGLSALIDTENPKETLQLFPSGVIIVKSEGIEEAKKALYKIIQMIFQCGEQNPHQGNTLLPLPA